MKWKDLRRSSNVEDRRGRSAGRGGGRRGSYRPTPQRGSGGSGLLWALLLSGGRSKWLILILLVISLFGGMSGLFSNEQPTSYDTSITQQNTSQRGAGTPATDREYAFVSSVLASTEDYWGALFDQYGLTYNPPTLVLYEDQVVTQGCGINSAAVGPFYCSGDNSVYLDLSFFRDLDRKYQAPGDFAQAYVLAHEVGHHVQNELGIMADYQAALRRLNERSRNQLNTRLELQADYFAGAWAHYAENQGLLEIGDLEEALQAATAVGDDTIQERAYGRVMPDTFTHGSAQQRRAWFYEGYQHGDFEHGDTFNRTLDNE